MIRSFTSWGATVTEVCTCVCVCTARDAFSFLTPFSAHVNFLRTQIFLNEQYLFRGLFNHPVLWGNCWSWGRSVCVCELSTLIMVCKTIREITKNNHGHTSPPPFVSIGETDRYLPQQNNFVSISFSVAFLFCYFFPCAVPTSFSFCKLSSSRRIFPPLSVIQSLLPFLLLILSRCPLLHRYHFPLLSLVFLSFLLCHPSFPQSLV